MDGEGAPQEATIKQALYWRQIYKEILAMEESVLVRIRELMLAQSDQVRREVELTNVPVVVALSRMSERLINIRRLCTSESDGVVCGRESSALSVS